jgi:hypothetical membrane protein
MTISSLTLMKVGIYNTQLMPLKRHSKNKED